MIPSFSIDRRHIEVLRKLYQEKRRECLDKKLLAEAKQSLQDQIDQVIAFWNKNISERQLHIFETGQDLGIATDASGEAIGYIMFDYKT